MIIIIRRNVYRRRQFLSTRNTCYFKRIFSFYSSVPVRCTVVILDRSGFRVSLGFFSFYPFDAIEINSSERDDKERYIIIVKYIPLIA